MNKREPDHLNLLCDMGELTRIVTAESDIETFLERTVDLVAKHLSAHVCSIYLFEESDNRLVLKATRGLNPRAVNSVQMKPGEGLVGRCFKDLSIIREGNASQNPRFKYFDQADEEPFNSFLCVPIQSGMEKIGVLVVQHQDLDHFTLFDERAIRTAVTQLAGAIENARLLMELSSDQTGPSPRVLTRVAGVTGMSCLSLPSFIKGDSGTSGSALGRIIIPGQNRKSLLYDQDQGKKPFTKIDFKNALAKTTKEMKFLQKEFEKRLPESASLIFTAHFMILKDKNFTGKMQDLIDSGTPPIEGVKKIARQYIDLFSSSPHAYMQEKAVDVEDLSIRILSNFEPDTAPEKLKKGSIAVGQELYPSDVLKLVAAGIRGIVLVGGGVTSHVTILSRSLQIPLIIADDPRLLQLPENTLLFMDADNKNIYINPEKKNLALFKTRLEAQKQVKEKSPAPKTFSLDNEQITLMANINLLSEVILAKNLNAEGVGLYRTEFPFLIRSVFPSEAEQYLIYKQLFDQMDKKPTTIRTLDAGGEKALSYSGVPREANPELGLRSIRFSLRHRDVFETQIRAVLRAAYGKKNIRIMFPLISSIDEFLEAKQIINDCILDLDKENIEHNHEVACGMMIELPSVLATIDEFAQLADFFAIGTNDFIQYMLGADRTNKLVADNYIPCHPAVNQGISAIVKAAKKAEIDVSVCGEMAHDPDYIPFLLGLGIRTLSVDPQFLIPVQNIIMNLSMEQARAYAKKMLAQTRVKDAREVLKSRPPKNSPAHG